MTLSIQDQRTISTPIHAATDPSEKRSLVPAGAGAAETVLERAQEPLDRNSDRSLLPGFFETCVVGIKNLIAALFAGLFRAICSCFRREKQKLPPTPQDSQPQNPDLQKQELPLSTSELPSVHPAEHSSVKEETVLVSEKADPSPPPQPSKILDAKTLEKRRLKQLRNALIRGRCTPQEIVQQFHVFFPLPEEKRAVYLKLGRGVPLTFYKFLLFKLSLCLKKDWINKEYLSMGQRLVKRNPDFLLPSLLRKIHRAAHLRL